jgi:hypothetical protein
MRQSETVELQGHIFDTGVFAQLLNDVIEYGGDYRIEHVQPGRGHTDESIARLVVSADDVEQLSRILMRLQTHGVNQVTAGSAMLRPALRDGVFPDDFYSTTNLDTQIHLNGHWIEVVNPEMDWASL